MRLYVADARVRARQAMWWHLIGAVTLAISIVLVYIGDPGPGTFLCGIVCGHHFAMAEARLKRSRELGRVASGYVEVTPGITVVTLNPNRARKYEVDPHLRN